MTDLATALATDPSKLPDYAGRPVVRTTISIRNAGDGLSEGLGIDPQVLPLGDKVYVVLECTVHAHDHDRLMDKGNDTGMLVLDQVLKAGTGTLIDADVVKQAIADQAEVIQRAKEKAQGLERLPYPEELQKAHDLGEHASGLVAGCPSCDSETQAARDEAAADGDGAPAPTPIAGRARKAADKAGRSADG